MAIYKDRTLVPVTETWNLQAILGERTLQQSIDETLALIKKYAAAYKKRFNSLESFVSFHKIAVEFGQMNRRTHQYMHLCSQEDTLSPMKSKLAQLTMQLHPYHELFATNESEVLKKKALIKKFLKDERLKDFRREYELIFRSEPHVLPEELAKYRAQVSQAIESNYQIFSVLKNAETKFAHAKDAKGKDHEVSEQSVQTLMKSKDRLLRKNSYESFVAGSLKTKETYVKLLSGHFLAGHRVAKSVNFADQIDSSLYEDNVDKSLVQSLYKAAKANLKPLMRFEKAHRTFLAKHLKISYAQVMPYDADLEIFANDSEYSVEEATKLVAESVIPLGEKYSKQVQTAFKSRWIDFHMTPNKRSGAFSSSSKVTDMQPILMNFNGTLDSVSTLAHEMGHSMHSFMCKENNPYPLAYYPIFTAEVASNFCELLLTEQILKTSTDDKVKFNAISQFLDNFVGNVYRQLMFSEYELRFSDALANDIPLATWEPVSALYSSVQKLYQPFKDWQEKYPDSYKRGAVVVPHYFFGFYVYKYAVGMIGALTLMDVLKSDQQKGAQNYLKFISSGAEQWPADILKSVGVDLYNQKTLKRAFNLFDHYVGIYVDLGKKLLKVTTSL